MLRTVIVMDYQNVHLTAHDIFARHSSKHRALIHPMRFAETAIRRRNQLQREGYPHAVLEKVLVFRGYRTQTTTGSSTGAVRHKRTSGAETVPLLSCEA